MTVIPPYRGITRSHPRDRHAPDGSPLLASRTLKARRRGTCALCPGAVATGQRIGLTPLGWCHVACIVQANATTPKEGT